MTYNFISYFYVIFLLYVTYKTKNPPILVILGVASLEGFGAVRLAQDPVAAVSVAAAVKSF